MKKEITALNYTTDDGMNATGRDSDIVEYILMGCFCKIEKILRGTPESEWLIKDGNGRDVMIAAYLIWKSYEVSCNPKTVRFEMLKDLKLRSEMIEVAISDHIDEKWKTLILLTEEYSRDVFFDVAGIRYSGGFLSKQVIELMCQLIDITEKDNLANYCCEIGNITAYIAKEHPAKSITGYDIDKEAIEVARILAEIEGNKIEYRNRDVFDLAISEDENVKFSKIISDYPLGMRMKYLEVGKEYLKLLEKRIPSISKATSMDWIFNSAMVDKLDKKGKAIGIMTTGGTWNMIDAPIRKYYVENGLIETVIAMPAKLNSSTAVATSIIVFSHNNKTVRLVDATNEFVAGRRVNELSEENVKRIIAAASKDSEISMEVSVDTLRENDYVLSTNRYLKCSEDVKDGVAFGEVITRITRGAQLSAKDFDKIESKKPTGMQYLMLANIHDGIIDNNLPYLSEIDKKNEKYCLTDSCLIMSKNGYPYKCAVAEVKEGQKILANGNLYIIEVDKDKVDPSYLAAFFSSEVGMASLKSITVGATIPNIGIEQLKKLVIPIPSLEKQRDISELYKATKEEISLLELKIEKAKTKLAHIFDERGKK